MIDDLEKTGRLISELEMSLPLEVSISPALRTTLMKQSPTLEIPDRCHVSRISYLGEEGGIICWLDIGGPDTKTPYISSITHLVFDRRVPVFRQIEAYQRHRIKKLKQQITLGY